MKTEAILKRLSALCLCLLLLLAAAPLPQALAAPDDEEGYSDDAGYDEGEDSGASDEGEEYDGESDTGGDSDAEDTGSAEDGDADSDEEDGEENGDGEDGDGEPAVDPKTPGATNSDNVIAAAPEAPATNAEAALLISPETDMVLYEKNADERRYPASTTKIMTALLVLEHVDDLSQTVTAEAGDFAELTADSSNAGIKEGETVTIKDLLYGLMLPSGNECAYMLARHVSGSYEAFVEMMNQRAAELGCTDTHFSNPCGLHADDHYTTARDLYKIAKQAMQDETFRNIVDTVQHRMSPTNVHPDAEGRVILTTNKLILSSYAEYAYNFCKGIKTGNTSQAGNCFVGYAEYGDAKLYSVVMGCDDKSLQYTDLPASFTDTKSLFEWGFDAFTSRTIATQGDTIGYAKVRLSTDTDQVVLTVRNDLVSLLPTGLEVDQLEAHPTAPEEVDAPIHAGDVLGSVTYSYNGVNYGTVELVALSDVEMSRVLYFSDKLSHFFQSTVFKVILVVLAAFVVLYILFNLVFGGMRRRQKRRNIRTRYRNTNYQRRRRR